MWVEPLIYMMTLGITCLCHNIVRVASHKRTLLAWCSTAKTDKPEDGKHIDNHLICLHDALHWIFFRFLSQWWHDQHDLSMMLSPDIQQWGQRPHTLPAGKSAPANFCLWEKEPNADRKKKCIDSLTPNIYTSTNYKDYINKQKTAHCGVPFVKRLMLKIIK